MLWTDFLWILQQILYPRGKGLGGSGSINYLLYTRGSRYDFDEWEDMGCSGWSYKDVLPYFIKAEDNANEEYVKNGKYENYMWSHMLEELIIMACTYICRGLYMKMSYIVAYKNP